MIVKTPSRKRRRRDPGALRAFCARNRVSYSAIAARKGCRLSYVSEALRADTTGKAVSETMYDALWRIALDIVRGRG